MIGSGNMGSAMAKIIGENVVNLPEFDPTVRMYTYPEELKGIEGVPDGTNIVQSINECHMNKKYLPGIPLPENVVAIDNVPESCEGCDFIVIVTPHQFLPGLLKQMIGKIKPGATAISLVKGVTMKEDTISLVTDTVQEMLNIPCGALMGANIANDVAKGQFCESTIAFENREIGEKWKPIFNQPNFRIKVIQDLVLQQLCGTLKNIVATGVGFLDGLDQGESTKAAFIRIGMEETYNFAKWYFPDKDCRMETLLESCGVADFICTSYGGRNRKCAEAFVRTGKSLEELEKEILNGQKLQGVLAAKEVALLLQKRNNVEAYPLLVTIHMIATKQVPPETILNYDGEHVKNMKV